MSATIPIHPVHAANRERAISLLLASLPNARTAREVEAQANFMASLAEDDSDEPAVAKEKAMRRNCYAKFAGMRSPPSPETWSEFVDRARARRTATVDEVVAELLGRAS